MNYMIARESKFTERLFPPISPDFYNTDNYTGLEPKQQSAVKIVDLVNKKYNLKQQLFGWDLDAIGKIGRLLLLHKQAVAAEVEGQWRQANLFWKKFYHVLRSIYHEESLWEELKTFAFHDSGDDPGTLRQCMMEEVFIDMHCAFYNGGIKKDDELSLKDRTFFHADYLEKLIDFSRISPENFRSLFDSLSTLRIKLYQREKLGEVVIWVIKFFLARFPDSQKYQNKLALTIHSNIIEKLKGGKGIYKNSADADLIKKATELFKNGVDADLIKGGIKDLEKLRKKYPENIVFYKLIGELRHLHAVKLTNLKKFSEAFLSLQKSLTFYPYQEEEAKKTYKEIIEIMEQVKAEIEEVEHKNANSSYPPIYNYKVDVLKKELSKGPIVADSYRQSEEAKQILESFYIAQARSVLRELGFAMPSPEQWNEKDITLLNRLTYVFENPPKNKSGIKRKWKGIIKNNPELENLDHEAICGSLERRLFEAKKSGNSEDSEDTLLSPPNAPIINSLAEKVKQKKEPFMYWLFSREGIRYQLQTALVILLLLTAVIVTLVDTKKCNTRDKAFAQISAAEKTDDFNRIIQGAEQFFSVKPLTSNDEREPYVKKLYDKAIVRLFTEQTEQLDANALAHFERYRHLIVDQEK